MLGSILVSSMNLFGTLMLTAFTGSGLGKALAIADIPCAGVTVTWGPVLDWFICGDHWSACTVVALAIVAVCWNTLKCYRHTQCHMGSCCSSYRPN